jgi:hypothetical protein
MDYPITEIQQQINQLVPMVLVAPALILTASGLLIWLMGIRWLRLIAALASASAGLWCAWHFTDRHLVPMVLFAIIPLLLSLFLYKAMVVVLGGLLTAGLIVFVPFAVSEVNAMHASVHQSPVRQDQHMQEATTPDLAQSIRAAQEHLGALKQSAVSYFNAVPSGRKSLALMVALGVTGFGLFSWRLVCSATCSTLGTILIGMGMLLLLFYKGSDPLNILKHNLQVIGLVLIAMMAVGTLLQYWISPRKKKNPNINEILSEGDSK